MRLIYARPELLSEASPTLAMPADLERFWQTEALSLAKRIFALTGVTGRMPFIIRGGEPDADDIEFDQEISRLLRTMTGQVPGRTTLDTYGRHAFRLLMTMEQDGTSYATATPDYLANYKRRRMAPVGGKAIQPQSWNSEAAAIKAMFDAVVLIGIRPDNPCQHPTLAWLNKGASVEPEEPKFITLEQFRKFRDEGLMQTQAPLRNAGFAEMLLTSGMRLYEGENFPLLALPDEPERSAGRAFTYNIPAPHAKGHRARPVPVAISAFERMRNYRRMERASLIARWDLEEEPPSLWLNQSGEHMGMYGWEAVFRGASERSGVHVTPHALRHTFAVYMLSALLRQSMKSASEVHDAARRLTEGGRTDVYHSIFGDPLRKLQKLLGHKRYETTFIYLDVLSADDHAIDEALAIFDLAFGSEEAYLDLCS